MTLSQKYIELGNSLMESLRQNLEEENILDNIVRAKEYQRINLPASELDIRFIKSLYINLYFKNIYKFELDLSRIIEKNKQYTWYLNCPKNEITNKVLSDSLRLVDPILPDYINSVRTLKKSISSKSNIIGKTGYLLCENSSRSDLISRFTKIMLKAVIAHKHSSEAGKETSGIEDSKNNIEEIERTFDQQVLESSKLSSLERLERLSSAPSYPERQSVVISVFKRNPDVVAEVLARAQGICKGCNRPAPFFRARDNRPYLEVHHIVRLADGGKDSLNNAVALCPNCHKKAHFG